VPGFGSEATVSPEISAAMAVKMIVRFITDTSIRFEPTGFFTGKSGLLGSLDKSGAPSWPLPSPWQSAFQLAIKRAEAD
jgi:hypothetical protein